jgi:energy-coupling factor transport system ATP-binding protein
MERAWPLADRVLALGPDGAPIGEGSPDEVVARSGETLRRAGIWLPASVEAALDRAAGGQPMPDGVLRSAPPTPGPAVVVAEGVDFGYERSRPVLRDVSLAIAEGERVALVGPNGSGKSTLARLLVGLLRPSRGRVDLDGTEPARLPARELARRAGLVFQDPEQQFLADRVTDEVMVGLPAGLRPQAEAVMERLGLPLGTFGDRSPYALSGGEQRRLSLAPILVRRPRVVVLDEPTFGQDRNGYRGLVGILREHSAEGTSLVTATHDPRFVRDMADRTVTIAEGRVAADELQRGGVPVGPGSAAR